MKINFEIKILECKYDQVNETMKEAMIKELNDKVENDKNFCIADTQPNDFLFYTAVVARDDCEYYSNDVWLNRSALFESIESQLKKIYRGFEPTYFRSVEK